MLVSVPQTMVDLLSCEGMSAERAVMVHLAGHLYSLGKLSVGAAAEVAGMRRWEFELWLRDAGIAMPWTDEDLVQEVAFAVGS
jgi:predicted HTH domain antitoxin